MALILLISSHLSFPVQYEEALSYQKRHRNVEPPVFNEVRLFEAPIPELLDNNPNVDGGETALFGEHDENEVSVHSPNETQNIDQPLQINNNGANSDAVDDALTHVELINDDVQIENEHDNPNETLDAWTEYENLFGAQEEDETHFASIRLSLKSNANI